MKITAEQIFGKNTIIKEDKANTLLKLLINYVKSANEDDILPKKSDVSKLLNLSEGTVQNAYRMLEDKGFVNSKQKVGTVIGQKKISKHTSKREVCIKLIKDFMEQKGIKRLEELPSGRTLASMFDVSFNTVNSAIKSMKNGIVEIKDDRLTLAQKIEADIEKYIEQNCKTGDNIPTLNSFSKMFNVSTKTVHDAVKILAGKGIILTHRGRYGSIVNRMPSDEIKCRIEDKIFASAEDTAFYYYEKVQNEIKNLIAEGFDVGAKLPSVRELSKGFDINENTIRRALKILEEEGYIVSKKGRYGGVFVIDIPSVDSYRWLAVNPQYTDNYN